MAPQLDQRRGVGLTTIGVPLGPVDIDEAVRPFDIDEIHRVRGDHREVDLEDLAVAVYLEVVHQQITARQVIPQMRDHSTLRVVDRLPDWDHGWHHPASSMARSTRATASRSV